MSVQHGTRRIQFGDPPSSREGQVLHVLHIWMRSATAAELSREMARRHGMKYPVNDLLGRLHAKGWVDLVDGEWVAT